MTHLQIKTQVLIKKMKSTKLYYGYMPIYEGDELSQDVLSVIDTPAGLQALSQLLGDDYKEPISGEENNDNQQAEQQQEKPAETIDPKIAQGNDLIAKATDNQKEVLQKK